MWYVCLIWRFRENRKATSRLIKNNFLSIFEVDICDVVRIWSYFQLESNMIRDNYVEVVSSIEKNRISGFFAHTHSYMSDWCKRDFQQEIDLLLSWVSAAEMCLIDIHFKSQNHNPLVFAQCTKIVYSGFTLWLVKKTTWISSFLV